MAERGIRTPGTIAGTAVFNANLEHVKESLNSGVFQVQRLKIGSFVPLRLTEKDPCLPLPVAQPQSGRSELPLELPSPKVPGSWLLLTSIARSTWPISTGFTPLRTADENSRCSHSSPAPATTPRRLH